MMIQHHKQSQLNFKKQTFCIKLWNIKNGNCISTLRGHDEWISGLKLREHQMLSCSWDNTIRLWSLDFLNDWTENSNAAHNANKSAKLTMTLQSSPGNAIYCMHWSDDGNTVVCGTRHQSIEMWDLNKQSLVRTFMGHTKQVYCLQMQTLCNHLQQDTHCSLIVSGSADRSIVMWDTRTANCAGTFPRAHNGPVMCLQFDDHKIISGGCDKQLKIFDMRQRKCLHTLFGHSKVIFSLQFDDTKIISGSADTTCKIWNFT
ncbi:hypothetical protein RFI_23837 [Reticulomyxa filosa]|uniref:Uncharacterized protein n=1 Tax=Reticulomyxa filosa TaxID=46433 RepID=X6MIP9_RETFI|nr:hypothetical protein RFI_23837 [Reticulomyxa filosa]|eukprot:ETO13541.1 hypothetical protein RFI_23837 [Reticulomyxa filosa]